MVATESVELSFDRVQDDSTDENLRATLSFDVVFDSSEQQGETPFHVIGALVEVDDALDQYEPTEERFWTIDGPITVTTLDQTVEGARDTVFGVLGDDTVDATVGRKSFEYTEYLGEVLTEYSDHSFAIGSQGAVDEGVLDTDEGDFSDGLTVSAEFRGMVWVVPETEVDATFSGDAESVEFTLVFS